MATTTPQPDRSPQWITPGPTPSYPSGGSTSIRNSALITAPPAVCLSVLLDQHHPTWNQWVTRIWADSSNLGPEEALAKAPESLRRVLTAATAERQQKQKENDEEKPPMLLGTTIAEEVHMSFYSDDAAKQAESHISKNEITVVEEFTMTTAEGKARKGLRLAWSIRPEAWHLKGERVQEFVETDDPNVTEFTSSEVFLGPTAYLVKWIAGGQLAKGLVEWAEGLKRASEERLKVLGDRPEFRL